MRTRSLTRRSLSSFDLVLKYMACFAFYNLSLRSVFFVTAGFSKMSTVCSDVLVLRLNNCCAGELSKPSLGVLRQSNMASYGSSLDSAALRISLWVVFTSFSTFPLYCGKPGELVTCSKS